MDGCTTLYRPVGQKELDLIAASRFREFPPRLSWQPIFYPVLSLDYAIEIARDWNTKDVENGSVGYVTLEDHLIAAARPWTAPEKVASLVHTWIAAHVYAGALA